MNQDYINSLYEEVIQLCEIRGEMDAEWNEIIEKKIAEFTKMIKDAEQQLEAV